MEAKTLKVLENAARNGDRVTFTPAGAEKAKTLWGGLGNRAGLHSFQYEILNEKFAKSGERFLKRVQNCQDGVITVLTFHNITRDRGRWVAGRTYEI